MQAVIDFLNQGWVGIVVGLIPGIVGAIYYRLRSRQNAQIAYHYWTGRVLGAKGHKLPEPVKITFGNEQIEHLSRSLVLIWNHSGKTIYGQNIVESDPLRIEMGQDVKVLDFRLVKVTREVNNCRLGALVDLDGPLPVQPTIVFDYLDSGDGCVVELFHTDSGQPPRLVGSIHEMPRGVKNYKAHFALKGRANAITFFGPLGVALVAGGIVEGSSKGAVWVVVGSLAVAWAVWFFIRHHRRYPKALHMPEFVSWA